MIGREKPGQVSEVAQLISQTLEQERRQRELLERHYAQYDADDDEVGSTAVSSQLLTMLLPSHRLFIVSEGGRLLRQAEIQLLGKEIPLVSDILL